MRTVLVPLLSMVVATVRSRAALQLEILALRQQLAVLQQLLAEALAECHRRLQGQPEGAGREVDCAAQLFFGDRLLGDPTQLLDDHLWKLFEKGLIAADEMLDKSRHPGDIQEKLEKAGKLHEAGDAALSGQLGGMVTSEDAAPKGPAAPQPVAAGAKP